VRFTIAPLSDHTGAEAIGLDIARPTDAENHTSLARAFYIDFDVRQRGHLRRLMRQGEVPA
jgi:hypothetical protein